MTLSKLPVLVLNSIILFPHSEIRVEFDREKDKELISLAESYYNKNILIVHSLNESSFDSFHDTTIGVLGYIAIKLDMPNQKTRIVIRGIKRVRISSYDKENDIEVAKISDIDVKPLEKEEEIAYSRRLIKQLEYSIEHDPNMSNSVLSSVMGVNDTSKITDILAVVMPCSYTRKLEYLYEIDSRSRVIMLLDDLNQELKIAQLESQIDEKLTERLDSTQREYLLQEKLKVIKEELGLNDGREKEISDLRSRANNVNIPKAVRKRLMIEIDRYETLPVTSPEVAIIKTYIDTLLSLPWNFKTIDHKDLKVAKEKLDCTHFGLDEAKERIIEHLALLQMDGSIDHNILCLVGPPGVGKTTFAKSVADAMGRRYAKISVGGVNDEAEIVGHRKAYVGAAPGKIIQGIRKANSSNPVFVIDEIDKMTKDIKGDPASSLLEILDKEQNSKFCDNYVEEEFDLSNVFFICTANYQEQIPRELYDRLEIIEISSYTEYEKLNICKNYIIPKGIKNHGLKKEFVTFTDDAILKIIRNYTKEAGVRELERLISAILRKIVKDIVVNKTIRFNIIDNVMVSSYLGKEKYLDHVDRAKSQVGVVNAMSYTIYGGDVLKIEVNYFKGNGNIIMTGSLGDVFIESAKIAFSYIKSNCKKFGIEYDTLVNNDIHIHVPEGAIKKDGPSAGTAITTAIISAFTNKRIPSCVSMTGEITLRGEILPIGGLKEKIIGAKRAGVTKIFVPVDNEHELNEIDADIKEGIRFVLVSNYDELYCNFEKSKKSKKRLEKV